VQVVAQRPSRATFNEVRRYRHGGTANLGLKAEPLLDGESSGRSIHRDDQLVG
jgi:hypothetical protein